MPSSLSDWGIRLGHLGAGCSTCRDVAVRFVAANLHPDHNTIATVRHANRTAMEAAFPHALLAREAGEARRVCAGLLRLGTV